jgi:hypothetical protein
MCRKCTTDWLETQNKTTCPLCRAEAFGTRNETLEAVVKWDAFTAVCQHPDCGATLPVHQMNQHAEADCEHRPTHRVQFDNTCYDGQMNCETVAMDAAVSQVLESSRVLASLIIKWPGGQPHGTGKLVQYNGHTEMEYTGAFHNGLPHGRGNYEFTDNEFVYMDDDSLSLNFSYTYDGTWANGIPNGNGTSTIIARTENVVASDACIVNEFGNYVTKAHPYELFTLTYRGQFVNGRLHGTGTLRYSDSGGHIGQFEGDWVNDARHGHGVHTAGNMKYDGMWENNMRDGRGTYTNSTETTGNARNAYGNPLIAYIGSWSESERDGYGRGSYANGDVYKGGWSANKRDGFGAVRLASSPTSSGANANENENEWEEIQGVWLRGELQTDTSERRLIRRVLPTSDDANAKRPRTTTSAAAGGATATAPDTDSANAKRPRPTESTAADTTGLPVA